MKDTPRQSGECNMDDLMERLTTVAGEVGVALGAPLAFTVSHSASVQIWSKPSASGSNLGNLEHGEVVHGIPAGPWLLVSKEEVARIQGSENTLSKVGWIQGRLLAPCWAVLTVDRAYTQALKLSWPGMPGENIKYTVQWMPEAEDASQTEASLKSCLAYRSKHMTVHGIPEDCPVQVRVIAHVRSPMHSSLNIQLAGNWHAARSLKVPPNMVEGLDFFNRPRGCCQSCMCCESFLRRENVWGSGSSVYDCERCGCPYSSHLVKEHDPEAKAQAQPAKVVVKPPSDIMKRIQDFKESLPEVKKSAPTRMSMLAKPGTLVKKQENPLSTVLEDGAEVKNPTQMHTRAAEQMRAKMAARKKKLETPVLSTLRATHKSPEEEQVIAEAAPVREEPPAEATPAKEAPPEPAPPKERLPAEASPAKEAAPAEEPAQAEEAPPGEEAAQAVEPKTAARQRSSAEPAEQLQAGEEEELSPQSQTDVLKPSGGIPKLCFESEKKEEPNHVEVEKAPAPLMSTRNSSRKEFDPSNSQDTNALDKWLDGVMNRFARSDSKRQSLGPDSKATAKNVCAASTSTNPDCSSLDSASDDDELDFREGGLENEPPMTARSWWWGHPSGGALWARMSTPLEANDCSPSIVNLIDFEECEQGDETALPSVNGENGPPSNEREAELVAENQYLKLLLSDAHEELRIRQELEEERLAEKQRLIDDLMQRLVEMNAA